MRPTQWGLRGAILAVAGFALALGLAVPASEVIREARPHLHHFVILRGDAAVGGGSRFVTSPFWPSYALRLRGRPWKEQPLCPTGEPDRIDVCEFSGLGCARTMPDGSTVVYADPASKLYWERRDARP